MRIVSATDVPYQRFSAHRAGASQNKRLLCGDPRAADNFELSLVRSSPDYATPRHRHNFDQIRFMIEGTFKYGGDQRQTQGSLSYFPEGTSYTQQAEGESITLLLQFGGASGQGFLSYQDLDRGYGELSQKGSFDKGVFTWRDEGGKRHNKDAYESIWEHIMGRSITYPPPRYNEPILMAPENYQWVPHHNEQGVAVKMCGRFSERDIGVGFLRMKAGARHAADPRRIYYMLSGSGSVTGQQWLADCAFVAGGNTSLTIDSDIDSEMIFFDRPNFSKVEDLAA